MPPLRQWGAQEWSGAPVIAAPAPAIPPLPPPTTVAANDRHREPKQRALYGHDGNRQGRSKRGKRDGEICGRDADRGQAGNNRTGGGAEVAEDPSADSSNRDNRRGPARRRSRSSRRAHTEKLTKIVTKVQQELERINGVVDTLLLAILEGPQE